jgi:membrane protein implicated in regulation of membrane protease activity
MRQLGNVLIVAGVILLVLGIFMTAGGNLSWLGKLPGDIRITRPGFSFYFPITTSVILSIVISLMLALFRIFR